MTLYIKKPNGRYTEAPQHLVLSTAHQVLSTKLKDTPIFGERNAAKK